jgi:hypothetical protein
MSDTLESNGHIYINTDGRIMSVTIIPIDKTDLIDIIVPKNIAQDFLDGKMSMYDWTATVEDNGYTLTSNRNVSRTTELQYQHPTLLKVESVNFSTCPFTITLNHTDNTIQIDKQENASARFFITKKDDFSILYESIVTNEPTIKRSLPTCDIDIYSFTVSAVRMIHAS